MHFKYEFIVGCFDLFKHQSSHQFDRSYSSINHIVNLDNWDPRFDRPKPQENGCDYTPYNRYPIKCWENMLLHQTVDWDGYKFKDPFDYKFNDYDESIHTFDDLDFY